MKKKYFISVLFFICSLIAFAQEPVYFNTIYNPINTYASGRGILQVDSNYYGIFGTWEAPEYYYKLGVFKLDLSGNLINWSILGEDNHDYFAGSVGGTLIKTNDENFAFACQVQNPNTVLGKLIKLNPNLDTIWTKSYFTENYWTGAIKVKQAANGGYIIIGRVIPEDGDYYDLLLLRADIQGNELWYQTYGGEWSENGTDVIETTDGGYLIGGYFWKPGYDHSLDAMLIKTDSLGNEEWTNYYGNPDVDDDMALVALADDGNYLIATVYGEWVVSPTSRTGRIRLLKIDNDGNTLLDELIGPKERNVYLKNLRHTNDGNLIVAGWAYNDTVSEWVYEGLLYKFSQEGDSIWMRDYNHFNNQYDRNFFYDAYPTTDNGFIAIGQARPDIGGNNKMWIVKVDSMGCDTPGCATGTQVFELPSIASNELIVWPNPTNGKFEVRCSQFEVGRSKIIRVYNSQGIKVDEIKILQESKQFTVNSSNWESGLYFLQYVKSGEITASAKVIKN